MFTFEKDIFTLETEIKPNRYARIVLFFAMGIILISWGMNELGFFHVGVLEMRLGASIAILACLIPALMLTFNDNLASNPKMKYLIIGAAGVFTFSIGILMTFHTTIMMLFPILFAMLYRSNKLGIMATALSFSCAIIAPTIAYLLGTWDIPLFQELILIGTNGGVADIVGGGGPANWLNVGKITLYLVFPRLLMIGSSALLLFNNIRLGVDHVNNQIKLNELGNIDVLTRLYNQNHYHDMIEKIKALDPETNFGVMFFDVNGLKRINDGFGHEMGDLLLKRCADSLKEICHGNSEAAFRVGGDEFAVLIEGATESVLIQRATQWEDSMCKINSANKVLYDGMVCSMALGYTWGKSSDIEAVIHEADSLMYRNKAKMKDGTR